VGYIQLLPPMQKMKLLAFISILFLTVTSFGQSKNLDIIKDFPHISDTVSLIKTIINDYNLEVDSMTVKEYLAPDFLTHYEKIEISGSKDSIIILEYDYGDGCGAAFPFKYQLLFQLSGELITITQFEEFELLTIFPKDKVYLKGLNATSKGNGSYGIYKLVKDKLVNLVEEPKGYYSRTFDAHDDEDINDPNGLNLMIQDINNDGFTDLIFSGKKHWTLYQYEFVDNVEYIYIYNEQLGKFKEKEDYHDLFVKRRKKELSQIEE